MTTASAKASTPCVYSESEVRRIAHVAFGIAMKRNKKLCSVDKANVLETTEFWQEIVIEVARNTRSGAVPHVRR